MISIYSGPLYMYFKPSIYVNSISHLAILGNNCTSLFHTVFVGLKFGTKEICESDKAERKQIFFWSNFNKCDPFDQKNSLKAGLGETLN